MANSSIEVRKRPVQARSKARVDAILRTAKQIISEVGSDGLKMNALAQRAEVPIGTVYQFFPNKSAVIHSLVRTTLDDLSRALEARFKGVEDLEDAANRLEDAITEYCAYLRVDTVTRDLLSSTQADKNLRELDQQDSKRNGDMMFEAFKPLIADSDHQKCRTMCFLHCHLTGSLARLSSAIDEQTAKAIEMQFIESARLNLMALKPAQ